MKKNPPYDPSIFCFPEVPDVTEEQYQLSIALTTRRAELTPKQAALVTKFEKDNEAPQPPWESVLYQQERRAIEIARSRHNISAQKYFAFHVTWLAARYGCSVEHALQKITASCNHDSHNWAAFLFRFKKGYRFGKLAKTGEKVGYKYHMTPNGRRVDRRAAQEAMMPMFVGEKELRASSEIEPWPLLRSPRPFIAEAAKAFIELSLEEVQAAHRILMEEVSLIDPELPRLVLAARFWDLLVWRVYGAAGDTAAALVPSANKAEKINEFLNSFEGLPPLPHII